MQPIETIFEAYKASYNEETPQTEEYAAGFETFNRILRQVIPDNSQEVYQKQQQVFDSAVGCTRSAEKEGFVAGFKMAVNLMQECAL